MGKNFFRCNRIPFYKRDGLPMNKVISTRINDKLFIKLNNHEMKNEDIVTKALHQFFENKEQNNEIITTLKENVQTLEKHKESLEIDKICLMQKSKNLQTKIDDLAQMYPSAVVLLGKTSESRQIRKNKWIFNK